VAGNGEQQAEDADIAERNGSERNGAARVAELPHVAVPRGGERKSARRRRLVALGLAGVAAIVLVIVLVSNGGGSKSTPSTSQPAATHAAAPAPKPKPAAKGGARLRALAVSSAAKGTALLKGRRLTVTVSGLARPAGSYEVWLYNDQIDAVPVTSFRTGAGTVSAKLPRSPSGYRYLDVSLEPADGNPNHSGQSVLRVPLRSLR
jgi:hypothetical protein